MKKLLCAALALCMVVALAACGGSSGKIKVGLITDVGGIDDKSFNQSAWEGLKAAEKSLGIEVAYQQSKLATDYAKNIDTFIDQNMKLIWGIGFMMGEDIQTAAAKNAEQQFAIIDFAYEPQDVPNKNIIGAVFAAEEASFLVGYIAGKTTKTNKVGHINGIAFATMEAFAVGFYAGVKAANPDCEVVGVYSGFFDNPQVGKTLAQQMYADGCDVIYAACGDTGTGVIDAANELGKWVIGVDKDQNYLAPDVVLTSALKRVDTAVESVTKTVVESDKLIENTLVFNLKNGGVGYATTGNHIDAGVVTEVEAFKKDIIDGKYTVPFNYAGIEALYPGFYNMDPVE